MTTVTTTTTTMTLKFYNTRRPRRVQRVQQYTIYTRRHRGRYNLYIFFCVRPLAHTYARTHTLTKRCGFGKEKKTIARRKFGGFFPPFYSTPNKDVNGNAYTSTHTLRSQWQRLSVFNENAVAGKFCVSDDHDVCIIMYVHMYM